MLRRVAVVGTTGAGKTTFARELAARLGVPHIELDALFHGPNWTPASPEVFRARVSEAIAGDGFVVDGNYSIVRDIVWPRLDLVVALDYPFPLIFAQLLRRTVSRSITREPLWNGNRESFRLSFASRESILLWALTSHRRHTRQLPSYVAQYRVPLVRLRSRGEAGRWLASLTASVLPPSATS
jgi:adenylate kinase family enzyme